MASDINDRLLSVAEAAQVMGMSHQKVLKMARNGEMPFKKFGATYHIGRRALCDYCGLEISEKSEG